MNAKRVRGTRARPCPPSRMTAQALFLTLLLPLAASAQSRPTLAGVDARVTTLETEHDRTRTSICAKFDFEDYRPFVCDARCDCLTPASTGEIAANGDACVEPTPGTIEAIQTIPPHDAICKGFCIDGGQNVVGVCSHVGDCPAGSGCVFTTGPPLPTTDSRFCSDDLISCGFDEDCAPGFTCFAGGCRNSNLAACPALPPASPVICESVPQRTVTIARLTGVTTPDAPDVVNCNVIRGPGPHSQPMNSNDALECVQQFQTAMGVTCP